MQVTETNQDGLKREFKVVIEAADLASKVDSRLGELASQVRVPGFRPGKVPQKVLKQRYGDAVLGEVLEKAVSDSASQAMQERALRPAMEPKIEIGDFEEGADLEYTMAVEVLPEIAPMDFATIELTRLVAAVPEKEIEETVEQLAAQRKETKPIESPRAAREGDVVVVDFVGRIEGKEFAGGAAEGYHLELGSNTFIEGFEGQLVGVEPGVETSVKATFPDDYANDELKGKTAEFAVTITEIRELVPAEINEAFATAAGFDSLEALRGGVRETLQNNYDQVSRGRLKRDLLDALSEGHDFAVPEGMVELEFDTIWQQVDEARKNDELEDEDKAKSEDELKTEYRAIAERRVRLGLLLSEVGQANNIQVSEQEVSQAVMAEAQRHPGHEREVMELYQKNPTARANLRAPIFEDKVVNFILELAKVADRDVSAEDLFKAKDPDEAGDKKPAKKPAQKKTAAKKAPAQKTTAKKAPAKKAPVKKAGAKKD